MKKILRNIYLKGRFAAWKFQRRMQGRGLSRLGIDVHGTLHANPADIVTMLDRRDGQDPTREDFKRYPSPLLARGEVVAGDWDQNTMKFEDTDVWQAFESRFKSGGKWSETEFYARVKKSIESGHPRWSCKTIEQFDERLLSVESLYQNIKENGYKSQEELSEGSRPAVGDEDEVHVHIDRNGQLLFADGRHRLCIAKLLGLPTIPIKVSWRHTEWVKFREEILYIARKHNRVYQPLQHPDLDDIPALHSHERYDTIAPHISKYAGSTLLDIGANWGYFCQRFSDLGLQCTAAEIDPKNIYFIDRLKVANKKEFESYCGDVLDPKFDGSKFQLVLALNIFHHFIKTPELHAKLEAFLDSLNPQAMVFEPHRAEEDQMQSAYKNYDPETFVAFVAERTGLTKKTEIGAEQSGRRVFLLEK